MGLFSEKKTYYKSSTSLLYPEAKSLLNQTIMGAILQNRNIATDLVSNVVNGIGRRANRLHNLGSSGNYPWGLPDGSVTHVAPQALTDVAQAIKLELGQDIEIIYATIDIDDATSGALIWTNSIFYTVGYYVLNNAGEVTGDLLVWRYNTSTNQYPSLNVERSDVSEVSPYFPIIPIMINQQYMLEEGQPNRDILKQACRYIGVKPEEIYEGIMGDPDNAPDNPVEDVFLVLAVSITDDTQEGLEYLYLFFQHLLGHSPITKVDYDYWVSKAEGEFPKDTPPINTIEIRDANYQVQLGWLYIESTIVSGVLTDTYETQYVTGLFEYIYSGANDDEDTIQYSKDEFIIRKQINATQYRELKVVGLVHINWGIDDKETRTTLTYALGENPSYADQALLIPLRRDLLDQMGTIASNDVMYRAIRIVVNDKFVLKLKWYETSLFRTILTIVAIVVSIFYPPAWVATYGTWAVAGYAIASVMLMRALMPAITVALQDVFGEELGLLLSVVAAAYFTGGEGVGTYVSASINVVSGLYGIHIQGELEKLQKELSIITEDLERLAEEEAESNLRVGLAVGISKGDSYAILDPETYIKRFKLETREPLLIQETTHRFTDMLRFTDRPSSYIRLGHTGV